VTVQDDLIFDLGLHKGLDAEFYLAKGFRVIGLEASPELCVASHDLLGHFGDRLKIVNLALAPRPGENTSFYVVPEKDDWGSLDRGAAEKGVESAQEITVQTTDLATLVAEYGVPYYVKCDLEGGDLIFLDQLVQLRERPVFVSVEMNNGSEPTRLAESGYEAGQIVNQWLNPMTLPPKPPREGVYVKRHFSHHTSGLFGQELPRDRWRPLEEIRALYEMWWELREQDPTLAIGWLDLHACRWETLEAGMHELRTGWLRSLSTLLADGRQR
jgi:FkbM family methyltransferase